MIDRIEALEERVAALVEKIHAAKGRIADLLRVNAELAAVAGDKHVTDHENHRLALRVRELEAELNGRDDRDSAVKDRLKVILNRIDALETEVLELDSLGAD